MDDQVKFFRFEQIKDLLPVANIQFVVAKMAGGMAETFQIPAGVSLRAKKLTAQVVVNPMNLMSLAVIMADRFRPDQTIGTGNQYFHRWQDNQPKCCWHAICRVCRPSIPDAVMIWFAGFQKCLHS